MRFLATLFVVLCAITTPLRAERAGITVFAAASLRGALDEIARGYNADVRLSYGGSGTIARQVAAGAPADVVILASPAWMDFVENNADVLPDTRVDLIANQLVIIGHTSQLAPYDPLNLLSQLGTEGRLAMGQRDAVPAGSYAREWLQHSGQWETVMDRLAETDNVRAALALVARRQAPVGIVYASDALAEPQAHILAYIPDDTHSPIVYPAAALTDDGQAFLTHLQSKAPQDVFASHGFSAVPE